MNTGLTLHPLLIRFTSFQTRYKTPAPPRQFVWAVCPGICESAHAVVLVSRFVKLLGPEPRRGQWWLPLLLLVGVVFGTPVRAAGVQILHGHVPAAAVRLQATGSLLGTTNLDLAIGLPLRNKEELNNLLQQIYDPASPNYRHYLTPEQFTEMFGPTEQDYQALIDFVKAKGLTVTGRHPGRVLLDVNGPVADIEKVFHLTMRVYQHPTEARTFYAPDVEPSLDSVVPVLHISGLDNYTLPHPKQLIRKPGSKAKNATPNVGSGPSGAYMGYDFRAAYLPGATDLTGAGQTVGLVEFDGYYASDITMYESQTGLPNVTLKNVLLDGFNGIPTIGPSSGNSEVALDIEMAISMAPGLSKVIIYEAGPNGIPDDILNQMVSDNQAKQLSCSWSLLGAVDATADQLFQQMAAQGQSFFNASGDSDAFVGDTSSLFPSDDPYIAQVGGTTLTTTGPGGSYVSETVWNAGHVRRSGYLGSGGGISTIYSIPSWQQGISMSANQGSTTMRNIPDVAMVSDNIAIVADNGQPETIYGTSCSAPLWAGFTALVNQQAAAYGKSPVGFVNPAIYTIGTGTTYTACFHDITTGNNEWPASPTKFYAVAGYDLCTGWGTPTGRNLIYALAGAIVPSAKFSGSPTTGPAPLTVTFSDSSTGTVTNRFWNFDDGATTNTTATRVLHTYHAAGTNTVTLIVSGPLGVSTNTQTNYVVVTVPDTTPPTLTILEPADYQAFTNAGVTVTGTASDASGIARVTVNGVDATLSGANWSEAITLSLGTNIITVIATDNSANQNTATQMVHAVFSIVMITSVPAVTNALLQVGNVAAVVAGETNVFAVSAVDPAGGALSYQWLFGDGTSNGWSTSGTALHAYTTNNCVSYAASVIVSDGQASISSNFTVTVACQLKITKLQLNLNFAKTNADSCTVKGGFELPASYSFYNRLATLDIGGAKVSFTLGSKGSGHNGLSTFSKPTYNRSHTNWTFSATLKNGSWQTPWADYSMINSNIPKSGVLVTNFPVIFILDTEAFVGTTNLHYTAKQGKSGSAK